MGRILLLYDIDIANKIHHRHNRLGMSHNLGHDRTRTLSPPALNDYKWWSVDSRRKTTFAHASCLTRKTTRLELENAIGVKENVKRKWERDTEQ